MESDLLHIHLVGGPFDGDILEFDIDEDDILPDLVVIPTSDEAGELYEIAEEDYSCGAPKYLYAGYDWESVGNHDDWEEWEDE